MSTRDWWLGIALVVLAVLAHASFPRYEWRISTRDGVASGAVRIDRWRGIAERVSLRAEWPAPVAILKSDPLAEPR